MKRINEEIQKTIESLNGDKSSIRPEFYSRLSTRMNENSYSFFSFKTLAYTFSFLFVLSTGVGLGYMYDSANQSDSSDDFEVFVNTYDLAVSTTDYIEFE